MSPKPFQNYKTLGIKANDSQNGIELFAVFNSYQKSRMDFLADITFGNPNMETVKDFFSDVLGNIDKNRILLENISGTNDYKYKFIVRNRILCENPQSKLCKESDCCILTNENAFSQDIKVSIPNDVLGCHAFYLILENFIRNSAKHGDNQKNKKIYINFNENNNEEDFYEVTIYDSSKPSGLKNKIQELNQWLNKSVLNEKNSLRLGGWGLIEMDSAAAYLRKEPLENINDDDFKIDEEDNESIYPPPNFHFDRKDAEFEKYFQQHTSNYKGKPNFLKAIYLDKHLGYRFFLQKPKELLVIYQEDAQTKKILPAKKIDEFLRAGIKIINVEKLKLGIYPHQLIIYYGSKECFEILSSEKVKPTEVLEKFNLLHVFEELKTGKPNPLVNAFPNRQLLCFTDDKSFEPSRFTFQIDSKILFKLLSLENNQKVLNEIWKFWIYNQFVYLESCETSEGQDKKMTICQTVFYLEDSAKTNNQELLSFKEFLSTDNTGEYFGDNPSVGFISHAVDSAADICGISGSNDYAEPYNSKDIPLLKKLIRSWKKTEKTEFYQKLRKIDVPQLCRLIEGTATTIYILDERLQELAENTYYKPEKSDSEKKRLQFTDILYSTHVVIPISSKDNLESHAAQSATAKKPKNSEINHSFRNSSDDEIFNLNSNSFSEASDKIIKYIQKVIKKRGTHRFSKKTADFLLIHLGIVEKLIGVEKEKTGWEYGTDKQGIKKFILDKLLEVESLDDLDTKFIIVSGRGKPSNLPEGFLYLNFSVVAQYCIENRLKFYLNEVVHLAKRI